jgi:hypothetical protein
MPMKSLAQTNRSIVGLMKFVSNIGESEMKKLDIWRALCVEFHRANVFAFDPKISYPPEALIKADPGFWSSK